MRKKPPVSQEKHGWGVAKKKDIVRRDKKRLDFKSISPR